MLAGSLEEKPKAALGKVGKDTKVLGSNLDFPVPEQISSRPKLHWVL